MVTTFILEEIVIVCRAAIARARERDILYFSVVLMEREATLRKKYESECAWATAKDRRELDRER